MIEAAGAHIFISAAEPSADLHGAALIESTRALHPAVRFSGVAGPHMRRSGCNSIYDMTKHSSMLAAAFGQARHAYEMLGAARRCLAGERFDAAVVIDAPTLNLPVAKRARKHCIPSLYYIAPQTWAWGEWLRIPRVRSSVDRVACIWPFEEPYFRSQGVTADYVGHPLFARLRERRVDRELVERLRAGGEPILAIMPGSRRQEIEENFRHQLRVAAVLRGKYPRLKVLISVANARVKRQLRDHTRGTAIKVEMHERSNAELLEAADLALVVSGTIALETAFHRTPMIVMYNSSRWLYQIFRGFIHTRYFCMLNILAGSEVVPEFMPYYRSIDPIASRALQLLASSAARQRLALALDGLVQPFVNSAASDNTAGMLLDMAGVPFRGQCAPDPPPPSQRTPAMAGPGGWGQAPFSRSGETV